MLGLKCLHKIPVLTEKICCNICVVCLKRSKINVKEAEDGPFFLKKKHVENIDDIGEPTDAILSPPNHFRWQVRQIEGHVQGLRQHVRPL